MTVTLDLLDLKCMISQSAQLGAAAFQKLLEPTADYVSQRDVRKWLKRIGQEPDILNKMLEQGLVHPQRTGEAVNSKIVYSIVEMLAAISAINIQEKIIKTSNNKQTNE